MESDLHRKIVLRPDVIIQNIELAPTEGLSELGELVLLKTSSDVITITRVMREILQIARTPHTPHELIQTASQSWGSSYESLYQPVCSFLKRMGKLGVLVYEEIQTSASLPVLEELARDMRFAGYTLLTCLSKNHKVVLYKCQEDGNSSQLYTLKVLLKRNPDEGTQFRFTREYDMLRALPEHANIRRCLRASVHNDVWFLLFEYVDGQSMSNKVDKVSLESKISIASQLMQTISHLHSHSILHGDIHASNFLIDRENNLHLIDLGMSHFNQKDDLHHGGVPRYMPPERTPDHPFDIGNKQGNYRSEIFQVGVCLYFLFSGNYPFRALLLKNLVSAIKYEAPQPLVQTPLGEIIPQTIASVIQKSMEKDPMKRYANVAEMMDAWVVAIDDETVLN